MKKSKIPEKITLPQLAELTGYSQQRLRQLSTESVLPPITGGTMPTDCVRRLVVYLRRDPETLQREKMLKVRAERQMAERENLIQSGRVKLVSEYQASLARIGSKINDAINSDCERLLTAGLLSQVEHLELADEMRVKVNEIIRSGCRTSADEVRATVLAALAVGEEPASQTKPD